MKKSKQCPKCGSRDILRVEGSVGPNLSGNNLKMGATIFSAIPLPRYVCTGCGYAEEWVDSRDLYQLREKLIQK